MNTKTYIVRGQAGNETARPEIETNHVCVDTTPDLVKAPKVVLFSL